MPSPEEEVQEGRKKRTFVLLAGGAASLLLPLLGVVYIKMSESKAARAPNSSVMFDRRESGDAKVNVSQTVTINSAVAAPAGGPSSLPVAGQAGMVPAPGNSSLDFVKGSNTYYQDKPAEAPKTSTPTAPVVAPAPEPKAEPKVAAKKGGAKPFAMPKLQGTKSISSFKSNSPKAGGLQGMTGVADPQAGKGGGDMNDMLKNIPGGIDNPEVQKLMQKSSK